MDYNSTNPIKSVHKLNKSLEFFLCTFSSPIFILSTFYKNMHKKTRFFQPGFVFVFFRKGFKPLYQPFLQRELQILLLKSFLSLKEVLHNDLTHHGAHG